jgi:hypothetical protein
MSPQVVIHFMMLMFSFLFCVILFMVVRNKSRTSRKYYFK